MGKDDANTQVNTQGTNATTPEPDASSNTPAPTESAANPAKQKVKMKKIKLPFSKENQDDVFVSVNDKKYQIKRGVEVEVPWFVYEVLANQEKALQTLFENQQKSQENVL